MTKSHTWRGIGAAAVGILAVVGSAAAIQQDAKDVALASRIDAILTRPVFRHSHVGILISPLEDSTTVYERDADKLFHVGSIAKLASTATALNLLGAEFRYTTRVYRVGRLDGHGTLHGDIVLFGSGDPNLSGRLRPDGTLAFAPHDHSYANVIHDAQRAGGEPLMALHSLAEQVAAHGVRRVTGRIRIDTSLFPEGRETGAGVAISPIVVNDNVIDVTVSPGPLAGQPARLEISPETSYVRIRNEVRTNEAGSPTTLEWSADQPRPTGGRDVTLRGTIAAGSRPQLRVYAVPEPRRFAESAFSQSLRAVGIRMVPQRSERNAKELPASYARDGAILAVVTSPPLSEDIKLTLKVSQNLHAALLPITLGVIIGKNHSDSLQAGLTLEREWLERQGLDTVGIAQSDGNGSTAIFTPRFVVDLLRLEARSPYATLYRDALPVLGRDGTLAELLQNSPAAGHVQAKDGVLASFNALRQEIMIEGIGIAGYLERRDGHSLAFAVFVNFVGTPPDLEHVIEVEGMLAEMAAAAYE